MKESEIFADWVRHPGFDIFKRVVSESLWDDENREKKQAFPPGPEEWNYRRGIRDVLGLEPVGKDWIGKCQDILDYEDRRSNETEGGQ